jgi:lipopolysaccharide heptosyltransferase II
MVWAEARRILGVRLDAVGDVLMTTPALRALKENRPERHLTLLTSSAGAAAARLVPECDAVMTYDTPWMKATAPRQDSGPEHAAIERLRESAFDAAVIFTVYTQNPLPAAFLCYLADIPLRLAHCRENPYQLLTDWVQDWEPEEGVRHEVRRQLDLVAAVGCQTAEERLSLHVPEKAKEKIEPLLRAFDARPWTVIHPGASAPSRRYPAEKFAEVARQIVCDHGVSVIFTGSAAEKGLVEAIREDAGVGYSLAGELELPELAALLGRAPLLISNNTGPAHVAAAVGTPVVDLYALTNPQHTPWGVPSRVLFHDVPCRFCLKSVCSEGHHHCLTLVEPGEVVQAALELLEASPVALEAG